MLTRTRRTDIQSSKKNKKILTNSFSPSRGSVFSLTFAPQCLHVTVWVWLCAQSVRRTENKPRAWIGCTDLIRTAYKALSQWYQLMCSALRWRCCLNYSAAAREAITSPPAIIFLLLASVCVYVCVWEREREKWSATSICLAKAVSVGECCATKNDLWVKQEPFLLHFQHGKKCKLAINEQVSLKILFFCSCWFYLL